VGFTYDTASYEGYGHRGADYDTGGITPAPAQDPAGFGGEYGYYGDRETGRSPTLLGLLCLTHRYYDPGTGRFVTRDPSGYGGGVNLYGFAGDNPVNETDPSGLDSDANGKYIQGTPHRLTAEVFRGGKLVYTGHYSSRGPYGRGPRFQGRLNVYGDSVLRGSYHTEDRAIQDLQKHMELGDEVIMKGELEPCDYRNGVWTGANQCAYKLMVTSRRAGVRFKYFLRTGRLAFDTDTRPLA
jgi:RHS repeat-associated protein